MNREPGPLRLGGREFGPRQRLVLAIVNRTPDSFYRPGITWDEGAAMERVHEIVAQGADILDVGGVPAKPGAEIAVEEETRRVVPFIEAVRAAYPDLVISVDTWRHEVGRAACEAGANLLNDTWGGWDPKLAEVAAEFQAGLVCSHAGGLPPRTRPFRLAYDDVVADVLSTTAGLVDRALHAGVEPERIIIDPAHDFGKNSVALAGDHPAARRADRDRLAGAPVGLAQGLRRRDARSRDRGPPVRHAGRHRRRRLARGTDLPGA